MSRSVQRDQLSLSRPSLDFSSKHTPGQSMTGHHKSHYQLKEVMVKVKSFVSGGMDLEIMSIDFQ